ncbi:MAG: phage tail protein [Crocinitomicaceae bacterium]|nr:phage tail protein [Crocinitomicaceae bacterium]
MNTPEHNLPLSFRFVVDFNFKGTTNTSANTEGSSKSDVAFQSVSGLSADIETEDYAEGGENRFKHTLPNRTKFPNLVLKRGFAVDSKLTDWIKNAIHNFQFEPIDLTVSLKNEYNEPIFVWNIVHVIPVKYEIDSLDAQESKILIETLELSYNYFTTDNTQPKPRTPPKAKRSNPAKLLRNAN